MSKEKFRDVAFKPDSLERIEQMNECLDEVLAQGIERVTGRSLHYLMVGKNYITNTKQSYKALMSLLTDARYAGMVDWEIIEDREREVDEPSEWSSLASLVRGAIAGFRLPRWEGQGKYVELWVEKRTLLGLFEGIARDFHVPILANKGYSSAAAIYQAAERFKRRQDDERCFVLYVDDHAER